MTTSLQKLNPKAPPALHFSPTAWAKLLFLRDAGDTEIGGFGLADDSDLLLVSDIGLVRQTCTWASVQFDDESVADFFDDQVDAGRRPEEFGRIWVHTHPGSSPQPSATDEATFTRVFGRSDWALMFILARGGQTYARLRFNVGPGGEIVLPVEVDYSRPFAASDRDQWQVEYDTHVVIPPPEPKASPAKMPHATDREPSRDDDWRNDGRPPAGWYEDWYDYAYFYDEPKGTEAYGYIRDL